MRRPSLSDPPRPRYRVVERGRRLEVIDTHTGAPATRAPPGDAPKTPPALYRAIALALCAGATDAQARPLLSTAPAIDAAGPRTIPLGPIGVRRLAGSVLAIAAALAALLIVGATIGTGLLGVLVFAIIFGASRVRPATTRLFDGLAALDGR